MSDFEPVPQVEAAPGDPDHERIMQIMGRMLGAAAWDQNVDGLDPAHHTALTIAAAGFAAGYLVGASIVAGSVHDRDKRRLGEMQLTNFRAGIKIGKDQAMVSLTEQMGAGHA